jgi:hypothetical protein
MTTEFFLNATYFTRSKKLSLGTSHIGMDGTNRTMSIEPITTKEEAKTVLKEMGLSLELQLIEA